MAWPTVQAGGTAMNSRLHPPAGGVFRVVEAAGERDALRRRQLLENFGLLFLRQIVEDRDGIVGFDLAHAFGDRPRRQFVENFARAPRRRLR